MSNISLQVRLGGDRLARALFCRGQVAFHAIGRRAEDVEIRIAANGPVDRVDGGEFAIAQLVIGVCLDQDQVRTYVVRIVLTVCAHGVFVRLSLQVFRRIEPREKGLFFLLQVQGQFILDIQRRPIMAKFILLLHVG